MISFIYGHVIYSFPVIPGIHTEMPACARLDKGRTVF